MEHKVLTSMPDSSLRSRWDESLAQMPLATNYVTPNYFIDPYVSGERFAVLGIENDDSIAAVLTGVIEDVGIVS